MMTVRKVEKERSLNEPFNVLCANGSSHVAPKAETGQAIKIQSEGPDNVYRVGHLLAGLGWVISGFGSSRAVGPPL